MRQTLRVITVGQDAVWLEVDRASACASCGARAGCGAGALAEMIGGGKSTIRVPRTCSVHPGDAVVVAMPARAFLGGAVLAYLLPPASLALMAGGALAFGVSDLVAALVSLPVLALSLVPLLWVERRGRMRSQLRIETVIPAKGCDGCAS